MPSALLVSQFHALEPLGADEARVLAVDAEQSVDDHRRDCGRYLVS